MEKHKKELDVIHGFSLRELVIKTNEQGIQKDDILSFVPTQEDGFYLLYFK